MEGFCMSVWICRVGIGTKANAFEEEAVESAIGKLAAQLSATVPYWSTALYCAFCSIRFATVPGLAL